jgi:phage head maturation protease
MAFDKALHPDCDTEGPFGVPMKDAVAKAVEKLLADYKETRDDAILKLAGVASVEIAAEDRTEVSKITTEAVDRDKEVVIAKGIDLAAYNANPVVLLNHNWTSLPIGKSKWIKPTLEVRGLKAKTQYAERPSNYTGEWVPESVYSLIKQDMLPGKSIGFLPLEARPPEKAEIAQRPELKDVRRIITKSILLEYSVVGIPSNPEALVQIKAFPALAKALDLPVLDLTNDGEPMEGAVTLPGLLAEIQALKALIPDLAPILERIGELEKDSDGLKKSVRSIRRDFLTMEQEEKAPRRDPACDLLSALKRHLGA